MWASARSIKVCFASVFLPSFLRSPIGSWIYAANFSPFRPHLIHFQVDRGGGGGGGAGGAIVLPPRGLPSPSSAVSRRAPGVSPKTHPNLKLVHKSPILSPLPPAVSLSPSPPSPSPTSPPSFRSRPASSRRRPSLSVRLLGGHASAV